MTKLLQFPGLGLEFELNPVAFEVFGWPVHWYGIIIACGFLLAVMYGVRKTKPFGVDTDKAIDMLLYTVPLAILGARAYYVIFYLELYLNEDGSLNWGDAIAIWDGGLAIYGAVIVTVLTVAVLCRFYKQRFRDCMDVAVYGLLIGQLVGRWGNFVNVEAYGGLTELPWRMCSKSIANELWYKGLLETEEMYQAILDGTLGVHPTFLYESLWNLLGFVLLVLVARKGRKFSGQIFLSYVVWYGFGRAMIEGLRTDSLYFFNTGVRTSQMLGLVSAVVALALMLVMWKKAGPATPPLEAQTAEEQTEETPAEEQPEENLEEDEDHGSSEN